MEHIIGFDALYESMNKCKKGVIWKDSVAHFVLNSVEEVLKLEAQLKSGDYHSRKGRVFTLQSPKRRQAMGIPFRDSVYQREGRGGYVLQCDISGYYPKMSHKTAEESLRTYLKPEVAEMAIEILREQYDGDVGYLPGSQLVQLLGISVLNPMDHYIKEKLQIKEYLRYMDDFLLFHKDKEYLEYCKDQIEKGLNSRGFVFNPKKTRIYPITEKIRFLGFYFTLTETGKVVMLIDPKNVKAERKKLRRMVNLAKKGKMTRQKVDECYKCWRNHASKGNSRNLLRRMDKYYRDLW